MGNRGITLIELVMVMVIVSIVAFVVGDSLVMGLRAHFAAEDLVEATEKGRTAMERLEREIRNAIAISNATASASVLCFDDIYARTVSFRYAGTQLLRQEWSPPDIAACPGAGGAPLAEGITSFSFGYVDDLGAVQAAPGPATRRVRVNLTSAFGDESVALETEAYPANVW